MTRPPVVLWSSGACVRTLTLATAGTASFTKSCVVGESDATLAEGSQDVTTNDVPPRAPSHGPIAVIPPPRCFPCTAEPQRSSRPQAVRRQVTSGRNRTQRDQTNRSQQVQRRPPQVRRPGHEKSGFFSATLLTCRGRFRRAPRTGRGTDAGAASAQNAHTEIPMQDHRASPVRSRCRYSGQRTPRPSWSGICPGERAQTGTRDELRNYRPSTGASGLHWLGPEWAAAPTAVQRK